MQTIRIEAEKKRLLTTYNLALSGWRTSLTLLAEIRERKLKPDFGLFEGMMVGVCALYGRPFKRASGLVRLDKLATFGGNINEAHLTAVHDAAIEARDLVLAHQDVAKWPGLLENVPDARPIDETIVTVLPGKLGIESGMMLPQGNLHELLPGLLEFQIGRLDRLRFNLVMSSLPPDFIIPAEFKIEAL